MSAQPYGLIAAFDTPREIYLAAQKARDAGYRHWDCITPFPVHGLDRAMGLKRSIVPRISLAGGITGFCTGMSMIWYMNGFDYRLTVGGKPYFSPLFAFPISYELTILFTAFATLIGMFCVNGLTKLYHPVLKFDGMARATDDRFYLVIEAGDPRFDAVQTRSFLAEIGGRDIDELEAEAMRTVYLVTAFVVILTVSLLGIRGMTFTHAPMDVFPEWAFPAMRHQPKYKPQGSSDFFSDGRADRPPPPGVVAASVPLRADSQIYLGKNADGAWVSGFPAAVTVDMKLMERGRDRYAIYCSPCHGAVGDGNGVTKRYGMGATPSYHDDRLRKMPEGQIFNTITNGLAPAYNMPPYADKLSAQDRWAIVAYVRALQRAKMGTAAEVPPGVKPELDLP